MPVKIFCVAGFLAWVAAGVWAEEKGTEEKKKEPAGEGEVGVGSEKGSGLRQFFEEESFFGAVGAAEGDEGVGAVQYFPK